MINKHNDHYTLNQAIDELNMAWIQCYAHDSEFIDEAFILACYKNKCFDFVNQIIELGVTNLASGCQILFTGRAYGLLFDILNHYGKAQRINLINHAFFRFHHSDFSELSALAKTGEHHDLIALLLSLMPNHTTRLKVQDKYYDQEDLYCYDEVYNTMLRDLLLNLQSGHNTGKQKEHIVSFIILLSKKKFPLTADNIRRIKIFGLKDYFPGRIERVEAKESHSMNMAHHLVLKPGQDIASENSMTKHLLLKNLRMRIEAEIESGTGLGIDIEMKTGMDILEGMSIFILECWNGNKNTWVAKIPDEFEMTFLDAIAHQPYRLAFFSKYFRYDRAKLHRKLIHSIECPIAGDMVEAFDNDKLKI